MIRTLEYEYTRNGSTCIKHILIAILIIRNDSTVILWRDDLFVTGVFLVYIIILFFSLKS